MRIAFISFSAVPFGPNDLLFYQAAQTLVSEGHQVLVSVPDWKEQHAIEFIKLEAAGAVIHLRPRYLRYPSLIVRNAYKVWHRLTAHRPKWNFIDEFEPDAIVICDPGTYYFASAEGFIDYLNSRDIPYFTISQYNDENTSLDWSVYNRTRICFKKARHCVFVSRRNLEVARRQLCLPLPNGIVLHNPPRLETFAQLPFPNTTTISLAMVARLECGVKGQALTLQALATPAWRERDWRLELYGKGPDEAYLRDLIQFLQLEDRVFLCGFVTDIRQVWVRNHLLIMASTGEGKPLALTEAMLCGRPAVVTDVAGNAELIENDVSGFVAESATLASISRALECAWLNRDRWQIMGSHAHAYMKEQLANPPARQLVTKIIDSVVS